MSNQTFLGQLTSELLNIHLDRLSELTIILPNKRAKVFLLEEIKLQIKTTSFAPEIISIEELIQEISGLRSIDSVALLFEFYEVYLSLTENPETFDSFANWAKTLLQDFNEIDRYLIEPDKILKYLENIKEVEHWSLSIDKKTELIEKYLAFWKKLPIYYSSLYTHLQKLGVGYQGMIYREAKNKMDDFSKKLQRKYVFAGFNALNKSEEYIIQHLLSKGLASIYWDIEESMLEDLQHDVGLFQRKIKTGWNFYKTNPYEWIVNHFKEPKNIEIISTSKSIGQAKIASSLIEKISKNKTNLQDVALVLGDENLLLPLLYSLPSSVDSLNITMGFTSKNNPVQLMVSKLFQLHVSAINRNVEQYVMYYKDVLDVLTHPLVESTANTKKIVDLIKKNNYTFITHQKLFSFDKKNSTFFELLFNKWHGTPIEILENIQQVLLELKSNLSFEIEEEKITNAFLYSIYKVINQIISYFERNPGIVDVKILYEIYKQVIENAEVSFEGEPLKGLQIMGVLESRVLNFETVIITSVNEGKFPAGKSYNSFIPYDVKREYELPTYKEKDAIYAYHFYHLLQRAKNIYLIYNSDNDGFDSGEKSRFITQLEVERNVNHTLTFHQYNAEVPPIASTKISVPKTESLLRRLQEIAVEGFSPSSLTTYIRNPIQFYYQRVLRIKETDEVEENIAVNTLGTIIHGALEELYKPFIGRILTKEDIQNCIQRIDVEVLAQFKKEYKEGEIKKGRNLLAFEVAKRNILNFLKLELESIEKGDEVQIIALEQKLERTLEDARLPFSVLIKGNVDRIELRNGIIRIVDYKTGKVEKANVTLKDWSGLTEDIKNEKVIQVLAYAYLFEKEAKNREMEAGIISFKNLKTGFMPFTFKEDKKASTIITSETLDFYLEQIITLLLQIFDKDIPFEEKI